MSEIYSHTGTPALIGVAQPKILIGDFGGTWSRMQAHYPATRPESTPSAYDTAVRYPTPFTYGEAIEQVAFAASNLLGRKKPDAFGFGVAGQIDKDGVIVTAGKLAEYGWVGEQVTADIAQVLGMDPSNVAGMNDVAVAAKAEQQARAAGGKYGFEGIYTLSTGLGGALYSPEGIAPDEPGHEFLRAGAMCGCGKDGCIEAHVSGSGIERKYGLRGEAIPPEDPIWDGVRSDLVQGFDKLLSTYGESFGETPTRLSFYGSVALKGPHILESLQVGLGEIRGDETPEVARAAYGDQSGLYGAYYLAQETLQ